MAKKKPNYDFLNEFANDVEGYEGLNADTIAIPFIRILQDLSPQLKRSKAEYVEDAEPGMLFNNITQELYGQAVRIVIGKFERYYIEWKPNRGGFVANHDPAMVETEMIKTLIRNEKGQLIHPETGNEFVDTYIYYVLLPDHLECGVCIFATNPSYLKEARRLNRLLKTTMIPGQTRKALPHFMIWNLEVIEMSNDRGDWYGPKFTFDQFVTPDLLSHVTEERAELPNKSVDYAQIEENAGKDDAIETEGGEVKY